MPTDDERSCAWCGAVIRHKGRGRPRRWCGDACRLAWFRVERAKGGVRKEFDRTCRTCGDPMRRGTGTLPQGEAECRTCRRKRSEARPPKRPATPIPELATCAQCGQVFEPKRATQKYCNAECRARRKGYRAGYQRKGATTSERGYGAAHKREREKWRAIVDAGRAHCCLCGKHIAPGSEFDLDHTPDRTGYRGAACPRCNRADGARRSGGWANVPKPTLSKSCIKCGGSFTTIYPRQVYCSGSCRPHARPRAA